MASYTAWTCRRSVSGVARSETRPAASAPTPAAPSGGCPHLGGKSQVSTLPSGDCVRTLRLSENGASSSGSNVGLDSAVRSVRLTLSLRGTIAPSTVSVIRLTIMCSKRYRASPDRTARDRGGRCTSFLLPVPPESTTSRNSMTVPPPSVMIRSPSPKAVRVSTWPPMPCPGVYSFTVSWFRCGCVILARGSPPPPPVGGPSGGSERASTSGTSERSLRLVLSMTPAATSQPLASEAARPVHDSTSPSDIDPASIPGPIPGSGGQRCFPISPSASPLSASLLSTSDVS
mmetsp:Transcript_23807/g.56388  ORF Transcript_23807/g.56388 Transcript_23807/m.56388 type:complete len:288 (-) Transcript_23807:716-1579(-)